MLDYIKNVNNNNLFEVKLATSMGELLNELDRLNVLDLRLMKNEKERKISLFGNNLNLEREYFSDSYTTIYKGSFAEYAQAQRHRTIDYQLEILENKQFFTPPIIEDDSNLVLEWQNDMNLLKDITPQGEIIRISEKGKYSDFILKCKERLCSAAQLEIMKQTKETLMKYKKALEEENHPLKYDIVKYLNGARCTFSDYHCPEDCKFKEGKTLIRKI